MASDRNTSQTRLRKWEPWQLESRKGWDSTARKRPKPGLEWALVPVPALHRALRRLSSLTSSCLYGLSFLQMAETQLPFLGFTACSSSHEEQFTPCHSFRSLMTIFKISLRKALIWSTRSGLGGKSPTSWDKFKNPACSRALWMPISCSPATVSLCPHQKTQDLI